MHLQSQIAYSVVDPAASVPPGLTNFPPPTSWPDHGTNTTCNSYLPQDTTLNRFLWVVSYLARNNFFVIIDDHSSDPTVNTNQTLWLQLWTDLVTRISADPIAAGRLIIDILNEPDSRNFGWDVMGVSRS